MAAIGFGLVAVGCGPETKDSGPAMDTAKMKEKMYGSGQPTRPGGEPTNPKPGDDLSAKVKALEGEVADKLKPLEKANAALGEKITEAKGDVNVTAPLLKKQMEATTLFAEVQTHLKGLASVKDQAGLDAAKKKVDEALDKLTTTFKDFTK